MKKNVLFRWLPVMVVAFLSTGFVSCTDQDEPEHYEALPAPAFADCCGRYDLTNAAEREKYEISTIEISENGEFVVLNGDTVKYYGKFDRKYSNLENFGRIAINGTKSSLQVTPDERCNIRWKSDGQPFTVQIKEIAPRTANELTVDLCRAWTFDKIRFVGKAVGKKVYDNSFALTRENVAVIESELGNSVGLGYDKELGFPDHISFTRAGSVFMFYRNNSQFQVKVGSWDWVVMNTPQDPEYKNELTFSTEFDNPRSANSVRLHPRFSGILVQLIFMKYYSKDLVNVESSLYMSQL